MASRKARTSKYQNLQATASAADPFKSINQGSPGRKHPEIMEMIGSGPSHLKIEISSDPNEAT